MDALSGPSPVCYSTMEADEFEDLSADEDAGDDELSEEDADVVDGDPVALCDRFIQPRFERWLQEAAPTSEQASLLREIFSRVTVTAREIQVVSSERRYNIDLELYGMLGRYRQSSQADSTCPVYDVSQGNFDMKANVDAELVFDGETLISWAHFVSDALRESASAASDRSSKHLNKDCLTERFGTDTVAKLGGSAVLLQFFGVVCADPGAACYAKVLPFGLSEAVLAVGENTEEPRLPSPKKKAPAGAGYPAASASNNVPARPPAASSPVQPAKPAASNSGPPRPKRAAATGTAASSPAKGSDSLPVASKCKAKPASGVRKPSPAPR